MPGVARDALDIQVEDNEHTIMGRRPPRRIDGTWLVKERSDGGVLGVLRPVSAGRRRLSAPSTL